MQARVKFAHLLKSRPAGSAPAAGVGAAPAAQPPAGPTQCESAPSEAPLPAAASAAPAAEHAPEAKGEWRKRPAPHQPGALAEQPRAQRARHAAEPVASAGGALSAGGAGGADASGLYYSSAEFGGGHRLAHGAAFTGGSEAADPTAPCTACPSASGGDTADGASPAAWVSPPGRAAPSPAQSGGGDALGWEAGAAARMGPGATAARGLEYRDPSPAPSPSGSLHAGAAQSGMGTLESGRGGGACGSAQATPAKASAAVPEVPAEAPAPPMALIAEDSPMAGERWLRQLCQRSTRMPSRRLDRRTLLCAERGPLSCCLSAAPSDCLSVSARC